MSIHVVNPKNPGRFETNTKRWYPPFEIYSSCPECGLEQEYDNYLPYPDFFVPISVHFCCEDEEHYAEWTEQIIIKVTAEAV